MPHGDFTTRHRLIGRIAGWGVFSLAFMILLE